jgi:hypothetical protein
VWLEYNWRYGKKVEETLLRPDEFQLVICTSLREQFSEHGHRYSYTWEMEKVDEEAMRIKNYHKYKFWIHYDSNLVVKLSHHATRY